MSKSKDQTEPIPQSSSDEGIEAKAQPSKQSASSDNTQTYIQTTKKPLTPMLSGVTTDEKTRQHAMLAKVALRQLEKAGLIKRFKVLSKDGTTLKEIQIVFSPEIWTEDLELK